MEGSGHPNPDSSDDDPLGKKQEEPAAVVAIEDNAADDDTKYAHKDAAAAVDATTMLRTIQQQAYFSVLSAFKAESRDFASSQALKELMKQLRITDKQHQNFMEVINDDTLNQELRGDKLHIGQKAPAQGATPKSAGTRPLSSPSSADKCNQAAVPSSSAKWLLLSLPADKGKQVATLVSPGRGSFSSLSAEKGTTATPWLSSAGGPSGETWDNVFSEREWHLKPGETRILRTSRTERKGGSEDKVTKKPHVTPKAGTKKKPKRKAKS